MSTQRIDVLIASPLEAEHVDRISDVDPRVNVLYAPELLPVPRYDADHVGTRPDLGAEDQARWRALLARADVSFDFDWWAPADMPVNCPRLTWIQATSAGIGQYVERTGLAESDITFTTAAGAHGVPLAEFALAGVLHFVKGLPRLRDWQRAHHWESHTTRQLAGSRVMVVGLGGIGREVARLFSLMGVEVWGVGRPGRSYTVPGVSRVHSFLDFEAALPDVDALILACPLTGWTRELIDETRLRMLRPDAVLVNIARGPVVDEEALVEALREGRLGGACLDVFAAEPLPAGSPLWDMDNVIVSPHSASTVTTENAYITDIFTDNLRRRLEGRPLRNLYSRENGY